MRGIWRRRTLAVTEEQLINDEGDGKEHRNGNQSTGGTGVCRVPFIIKVREREALLLSRSLHFLQTELRIVQLVLQATGAPEDILVFRGVVAFAAHHCSAKPVCNVQVGLTLPLHIITIPAFVLTLYDFWGVGITTSCASNTFQLWDRIQPPGGGIAVIVESKSFYVPQQYSV